MDKVYVEQEPVSGRQMCELIAEYFKEVHEIEVSPEDIWNMSPTGELWPVYTLYDDAFNWKHGTMTEVDPVTYGIRHYREVANVDESD